jgi:hypothetical protein
VIPMQDVLRLDNAARMNTPGVAAGNWAWRMGPPGVLATLGTEAAQLRAMLYRYNRLRPKQEAVAATSAAAQAPAPPVRAAEAPPPKESPAAVFLPAVRSVSHSSSPRARPPGRRLHSPRLRPLRRQPRPSGSDPPPPLRPSTQPASTASAATLGCITPCPHPRLH